MSLACSRLDIPAQPRTAVINYQKVMSSLPKPLEVCIFWKLVLD